MFTGFLKGALYKQQSETPKNLRNFLFSKLDESFARHFHSGNVWQRLQDAYIFRREINQITSPIDKLTCEIMGNKPLGSRV